MQWHSVALLRLLVPVSAVALAYWFRGYLGALSADSQVIVINLPYLLSVAAIFLALQFGRCRFVLASIGVAGLYWLIRSELQVSLDDEGVSAIYLQATLGVAVLGSYLLIIPERGIWNRYGLLSALGFVALLLISMYLANTLSGLGADWSRTLSSRPTEGYVLSVGVTWLMVAAATIGVVSLCLRDSATEAALLASLLALYLGFALLHLQYISIAMCSAAALSLVYGLLRSSHAMAYRDDLTGLLGRRALNERLKSPGGRYCIAMVDVDHFKNFNDKHGHDVGDQVLKLVASRLKQVGGGTAYRYGGEEFCIVFPRRGVEECLEPLERLRESIADYKMSLRDSSLRPRKSEQGSRKRGATRIASVHIGVTVSIGIAERSEEAPDADAVLKAADKMLYKAKRAGRNRVVS